MGTAVSMAAERRNPVRPTMLAFLSSGIFVRRALIATAADGANRRRYLSSIEIFHIDE